MQVWALLWHIRTLTDQPIALGGIGIARIIPGIIFALIGGAVADVYNRRHVLFLTQSAAALVALVLGLLTRFGHITIWHIYLLTAIQTIAMTFDMPARQSLIANLVPVHDLPNAFSLTSIAFQTGTIIGSALSGLVIAYSGLAWVYIINAISFLAVIFVLIIMGNVPQKMNPTRRNKIKLGTIKEGIRFIIGQPIIFASMILDFVATFFASANTLMPIVARDVLHVSVKAYGWLSAAQSVGAMIAALVISQLRNLRQQGRVFLVAVLIFGLATIVFGFSTTFVLAWIALALAAAADSVSMIIRNTIRQLQTPDQLRGRMTSITQIFFQGGPQLGEIEAGAVAQFFGAPIAIISGGIGCIVGVLLIARRWPQLRAYNGDEPILAGVSVD